MTETLTVRLDRAEKAAVQKLAGKSGASGWVRELIQARLRSQPKGFAAKHEAWLATQPESVDSNLVLEWFRKNRR